MQPEEIIKAVERIARERLPAEYAIRLFGSWAKGAATASSDIDVAIVGPRPVPWETMSAIKQAVAAIPTLRKIDIVDTASAGESLRREIEESSKPI